MHFKILEIHFLEEKSGKNPVKPFETGPEPEPDIEAGYPVGSLSSGFYLNRNYPIQIKFILENVSMSLFCTG